jgi:hypothetical protein
VCIALWTGHLVRWRLQLKAMGRAAHEKAMYTALTLWAVTDAGVLLGWFLRG